MATRQDCLTPASPVTDILSENGKLDAWNLDTVRSGELVRIAALAATQDPAGEGRLDAQGKALTKRSQLRCTSPSVVGLERVI